MYKYQAMGAEEFGPSVPTTIQSAAQKMRDWMGNNIVVYVLGAGVLAYVITRMYDSGK